MAGCVRQAWLVLGANTLPLEGVGYWCGELDLGYPTVREVVTNRPDVDGIDDRTLLMGQRAVTASITTLATAGAQIDDVADNFAPFMVPSARPVLHYVLDRPGAAERTLTLRAANYQWSVVGGVQRDIHLQWVAADPIARDPTVQTATAWTGATAGAGRGYNLVFPRTYPLAGGAGPSSATITSAGDVAVRPLLRIYGPVTNPVVNFNAAGVTAGTVAMINYNISGGHYVEVDCNLRTAYLDGNRGQNVLAQLDWVTMYNNGGWPLIPAQTATLMTMTGSSTSSSTQVQASWNDGYLT